MIIEFNKNNFKCKLKETSIYDAGKRGMEKLPVHYGLDKLKGNLDKEIFTVDVEVFNSQLKNIIFN